VRPSLKTFFSPKFYFKAFFNITKSHIKLASFTRKKKKKIFNSWGEKTPKRLGRSKYEELKGSIEVQQTNKFLFLVSQFTYRF
jgi:hypothetical protein